MQVGVFLLLQLSTIVKLLSLTQLKLNMSPLSIKFSMLTANFTEQQCILSFTLV